MFKRANKITSLLVAAASVMALVPAYAADVKKVDSEDGTVSDAVAYKDGKFFVDGEINDDEEAYYVADGKYNKLDDVDSGDDAALFGEKYLDVNEGDYTVDLDSGKVTEDDTPGDTADDAAASLRKKIKDDTDDRYDEDQADDVKAEGDLTVVPGRYGKVWYSTAYKQTTGKTANASATSFNVFTDTDGNYIDADYNLGKIKVKTTDDSVTVENTNDTYDLDKKKDALSASVKQTKVLAQDADNIYRLVEVTISSPQSEILEINGVKVSDFTAVISKTATEVKFNAVQKISKAKASDDVDGANYAKSVTTYAVADENGKALDATSDVLANLTNSKLRFTVAGGKLIAYLTDDADTKDAVSVRAYTLKTSGGFYYMDEEDKSTNDAEVSDKVGADAFDKCAVQTDVDGNLWRLDGGYIYKFDNTDDWDKVYKVDGSFDELSVYDKDNMAAWSEDDDVYSLIGGKSKADDTKKDDATTTTTTTAAAGWVKNTDGTWSYNKAGVKATGWVQDGAWYYLNANGIMQTGWQNVGGTWYYLNASGAMQTGWINDNGTWYYCNASGAMLANTVVDGYVLGASGAWVK